MQNSLKVVGKIAAHIKNPLNSEIDAAIIYFDVNTTFTVSVQNFIMTGKVQSLDMAVSDVKALFDCDQPLATIKKRVKAVQGLLKKAIDDFLGQGV